jgi:hypothetical protein
MKIIKIEWDDFWVLDTGFWILVTLKKFIDFDSLTISAFSKLVTNLYFKKC